jgi:hypothetical protein
MIYRVHVQVVRTLECVQSRQPRGTEDRYTVAYLHRAASLHDITAKCPVTEHSAALRTEDRPHLCKRSGDNMQKFSVSAQALRKGNAVLSFNTCGLWLSQCARSEARQL